MKTSQTFIAAEAFYEIAADARSFIGDSQKPNGLVFIWTTGCLLISCRSSRGERDIMPALTMLVHVIFLTIGMLAFWTNKRLFISVIISNVLG